MLAHISLIPAHYWLWSTTVCDYPAHCLLPYCLLRGNMAGGNLTLYTYRPIAPTKNLIFLHVSLNHF